MMPVRTRLMKSEKQQCDNDDNHDYDNDNDDDLYDDDNDTWLWERHRSEQFYILLSALEQPAIKFLTANRPLIFFDSKPAINFFTADLSSLYFSWQQTVHQICFVLFKAILPSFFWLPSSWASFWGLGEGAETEGKFNLLDAIENRKMSHICAKGNIEKIPHIRYAVIKKLRDYLGNFPKFAF